MKISKREFGNIFLAVGAGLVANAVLMQSNLQIYGIAGGIVLIGLGFMMR